MSVFQRRRQTGSPDYQCARGHYITGSNMLVMSGSSTSAVCRCCAMAFRTAKRHHRFNDDPDTIAHADRLYARYRDQDLTTAD